MPAATNIEAVRHVADLTSGFLYPAKIFPIAMVINKTATNGCRKKIKGNSIAINTQKKRVLGIKREASINGHESCIEINNSETPEKFTRLINKIIRAAHTNKLSFLFLTTNHESRSARKGIRE